jgi:RNA recognition motif-containing protein
VFVRNLPFKTTDNDLKAFFETLGYSVKTAKVCKDNLGRPRGFAFVDFATDTDAQKVVALGQVEFSDRTLSVAFANK